MERLDYYSNIAKENSNLIDELNSTVYITNSSLRYINPEEGGSPKAFIDYFSEDREQKKSKSLNLGSILHKYIEQPEEFIVADFDMPTSGTLQAAIPEWAVRNFDKESDIKLVVSGSNKEGKELYKIQSNDFHEEIVKQCGFKRADALNPQAIQYLKYLFDSKDKIALSKEEKDKFNKMKDSIRNSRRVNELLFGNAINIGQDQIRIGEDFKRYNEIAIYWEETLGTRKIYRKVLIDTLIVIPKYNQIVKIDAKTTSKSIFNSDSTEDKKGWFESWRIYRQVAYYDQALLNLYKNPTAYAVTKEGKKIVMSDKNLKFPTLYNYIAAVESFGYFHSGILQVDMSWILRGEREIKSILDRIAWHMDKKDWSQSKEQWENAGILKLSCNNINRLR